MNRMLRKMFRGCGLGMVAGMLVAGPVAAAMTVDVSVSGTPHQAFFSVAFDGDEGIAVGIGGTLLTTRDGGGEWTAENLPTSNALLGVANSNGHGVAVGQMGYIVARDGDGNWVEAAAGTQERLMATDINDAGIAAAVGGFGTVLVSTDGGHSWADGAPVWESLEGGGEMLSGGFGPNLYAVDVSAQGVITMAGEWGMVLRSDDQGQSWSVLHMGDTAERVADATLFGMHIAGERIIVVGQEGAVMTSEDSGETWTQVETESNANLLSVATAGNERMVITGMRDMLISEDGGLSWTQFDGADIAIGWYSGAAAPAGGDEVFVVGHAGRVLRVGKR
jgi:photosystem II stability/assembly factor-like uncharacterized protein